MFHEVSGNEKNFGQKGGREGRTEGVTEYHDFLPGIFCLRVPKNCVGEPLSVSIISGIEKNNAYEGKIRSFYKNLLSHSSDKLRRGTLLYFTNILVSKEYMDTRGVEEGGSITIFSRKAFV